MSCRWYARTSCARAAATRRASSRSCALAARSRRRRARAARGLAGPCARPRARGSGGCARPAGPAVGPARAPGTRASSRPCRSRRLITRNTRLPATGPRTSSPVTAAAACRYRARITAIPTSARTGRSRARGSSAAPPSTRARVAQERAQAVRAEHERDGEARGHHPREDLRLAEEPERDRVQRELGDEEQRDGDEVGAAADPGALAVRVGRRRRRPAWASARGAAPRGRRAAGRVRRPPGRRWWPWRRCRRGRRGAGRARPSRGGGWRWPPRRAGRGRGAQAAARPRRGPGRPGRRRACLHAGHGSGPTSDGRPRSGKSASGGMPFSMAAGFGGRPRGLGERYSAGLTGNARNRPAPEHTFDGSGRRCHQGAPPSADDEMVGITLPWIATLIAGAVCCLCVVIRRNTRKHPERTSAVKRHPDSDEPPGAADAGGSWLAAWESVLGHPLEPCLACGQGALIESTDSTGCLVTSLADRTCLVCGGRSSPDERQAQRAQWLLGPLTAWIGTRAIPKTIEKHSAQIVYMHVSKNVLVDWGKIGAADSSDQARRWLAMSRAGDVIDSIKVLQTSCEGLNPLPSPPISMAM